MCTGQRKPPAPALCMRAWEGRESLTNIRMPEFKRLCAVVALALLVFAALGPAKSQVRTGLGFQVDHFIAVFTVTSIVCLAWPRPFVVGAALAAASALLEGLEVLTPDRSVNFEAALYGAAGAIAAALLIALLVRVWKRIRTNSEFPRIAAE